MNTKVWTAEDVAAEDEAAIATLTPAQLAAVGRQHDAICMAAYVGPGHKLRLARLHDAEANRRNAEAAFNPGERGVPAT